MDAVISDHSFQMHKWNSMHQWSKVSEMSGHDSWIVLWFLFIVEFLFDRELIEAAYYSVHKGVSTSFESDSSSDDDLGLTRVSESESELLVSSSDSESILYPSYIPRSLPFA